MSYKQRPYATTDGGTGATTASGARTNLSVPLNTNTMLLDGTQAMTAALDLGTHKIVGMSNPTAATDGVNLQTLQSYVIGITNAQARVATTGSNITVAGSAPNTLDGVSLALNDLVLVKDQSSTPTNGLYKITTLGSGANGTWTRTTNMDSTAEIAQSWIVYVDEGTVNGSTGWMFAVDPDAPPTLGTDPITWVQFNGIGALIAGNGLTKTGNTIDVVGTSARISVAANSIDIDSSYVGQASITTLGTITTGTWTGTTIAVNKGGTNATTGSGARSNLSAAPNTSVYWIGSTDSELGSAVVPSGGTGITVTAATGVIAVDTAVVWTTSNTIAATNKTLTSPIINTPKITHSISTKTADYTLATTDDIIVFNISAGKALTLPDVTTVSGYRWTIKNRFDSTANVTVTAGGADTIDTSATYVLIPGDAIDVVSDGSRWLIV